MPARFSGTDRKEVNMKIVDLKKIHDMLDHWSIRSATNASDITITEDESNIIVTIKLPKEKITEGE